jgi:FkbM family methyltransferase
LTASHSSVLELGANIGVYTLVGAAQAPPGRPYRAVEANPTSIDALRTNLALNQLGNVQVVGAAAVGAPGGGTVTLHFPASDVYGASSGAFVDGTQSGNRMVASRQVSVPSVCVSDLIAGVDLMKLDVEGLELEVLRAVRSWIVHTRPTLVVEVLDESRALQRFLADLISEVSYLCVVVLDGRPVVVDDCVVAKGQLQKRLGARDATLVTRQRLDKVIEVTDPGTESDLRSMLDGGAQLR